MAGFSLIEVLVAMAIFVLIASSIMFLILDTYIVNQKTSQGAEAIFLAEQAMEKARAIRDNDWNSLVNGAIDNLVVEEIDANRKKITARVDGIELVSYLTNWK